MQIVKALISTYSISFDIERIKKTMARHKLLQFPEKGFGHILEESSFWVYPLAANIENVLFPCLYMIYLSICCFLTN